MSLSVKVALITGGGTGIGYAITTRFINDGAKVIITGRRKEVLEKAIHKFPQTLSDIAAYTFPYTMTLNVW